MKAQKYVRQLIQEYFDDKKSKNPRFSLRMLAAELGIAPAALSSFLKGKRNFSKKMAEKVLENISTAPEHLIELDQLFHDEKSISKEEKEALVNKMQLQSSLYYLLVDPLYYSYLSLVETKNFIDDDQLNGKKLGAPAAKVQSIKETLIKFKLIQVKGSKLVPTRSVLASTDNIPNHSLRARHLQNMEDSKHAITNVSLEDRYFAFETLSFDKEDLEIVQTKINQLMDDLIWLSKKGTNKEHVYEFCSHYFPRTK